MIRKPWWEVYPSRLEREFDALKEVGIEYTTDEDAFAKGILCLYVEMEKAGTLRVVFPDLYPYFRFEIYAPELQLSHHQNPFSKSLCLIGRSTINWRADDTLASFLIDRLPQVIHTGTSDNATEVAGIEEHQAEPFSDYYPCYPGTALIVDGSWEIDASCESGTILIGTISPKEQLLKGAVLEVRDEDENILAEASAQIKCAFPGEQLVGRWVRLSEPLKTPDHDERFMYLQKKDPYPNRIRGYRVDGGELKIRASLFPEEISRWRQCDYGWMFVCSIKYRKSWEINQKRERSKRKRR